MENNSNSINIFDWTDKLSASNPRFSSQNPDCRQAFLNFLKNNEYFGIPKLYASADNDLIIICQDEAEKIRPNLELWLRSYGVGNDEKLELLTERMTAMYPDTGTLFARFTDQSQAASGMAWKLADYLCFTLRCEITGMSDKELDSLAADMNRELPLNSARLFSEFLMYARENGHMSNGWIYNFNSRREAESEGAYTALDFLKMAYVVFNEESWKKQHLLEKALNSKRDANLWLFVALHFICGWRGTDIVRLPMPALPYEGAKIRERIAAGSFDTESIINEVEFRLRYASMKPQKTEMYENVPELKLFVPESLRKPIGIILAIAVSHHESVKPGNCFLRRTGNRGHLISFFGESFVNACGGHTFNSRRANKSYLQGIEMMADSSGSQPKGYMLAALARSHKSGFGTLPETTDIYLRDAKFSGYRPEFIAREMFERGVFSFIPALMMEMYARGSYTNLPVPVQTKVLAEIGIEASGLENIAKTVESALARARTAISDIMKRPEEIRGSIADILQNIASGNAPGRQDGFLCLMTASGSVCADVKRNCCIGCGYEIYTKTILHCLSKEYARLITLKKEADSIESARCSKILKEAVMPAIAEIFISIKRLYPDADIKSMINVTEMGAVLC